MKDGHALKLPISGESSRWYPKTERNIHSHRNESKVVSGRTRFMTGSPYR
jgi:hypothetical protein